MELCLGFKPTTVSGYLTGSLACWVSQAPKYGWFGHHSQRPASEDFSGSSSHSSQSWNDLITLQAVSCSSDSICKPVQQTDQISVKINQKKRTCVRSTDKCVFTCESSLPLAMNELSNPPKHDRITYLLCL